MNNNKKISDYKMQLIINKSLYKDKIIPKDVYEKLDNILLEKINILSSETI